MRTTKFKKIVLDYKNLVYSQALYSTGNRQDAADVTQDVLIKLWNNIDNIQLKLVKSWLLTVTRNHCIDQSRKKREQSFSELDTDNGEDTVSQIPASDESNPELIFDRADTRQRLAEAISRLPEKIRTSIILRYIQDEPYDVIAGIIGCPLNSVKVYLHRGRKMLADMLQEQTQELHRSLL